VSGKEGFLLFAVWTQNTKKQYFSYIGQLYMALKYYQSLLSEQCIIAGDWNSNKVFDHLKRVGTDTEVVKFLSKYIIHSTYHTFYKENQGEDTLPTHYFRKEQARPFHIDQVFASNSLIQRLEKVEVGTYENWIRYSDHLPIFVECKEIESL
jgi:exonuclease III